MANINGFEERVSSAVQSFWNVRAEAGVRSGRTLDAFVEVIEWVVRTNGMPDAVVKTGQKAKIPGFFRPSKSWDIVVLNHGTLIAAIELKSVADSFGKNANNRTEEALGSGVDVKEAFAENIYDGITKLFTGYIILVEDCSDTQKNIDIEMPDFKAMREFVVSDAEYAKYIRGDDGFYPKKISGRSYMDRFDILCRHMMQKQLYTTATVIKSVRDDNSFSYVSRETGIKNFLLTLASHIEVVSDISNE